MRYERKRILVDAVVWSGHEGVFEVIEEMAAPAPVDRQANDTLAIHTTKGTVLARFGDYVCKDIGDNSFFAIEPELFKRMYIPAEDEEPELPEL